MRKTTKKILIGTLGAMLICSAAACQKSPDENHPKEEHGSSYEENNENFDNRDNGDPEQDYNAYDQNQQNTDPNEGNNGAADDPGYNANQGVKRANPKWEGFYTDNDYYSHDKWGYARIIINEEGKIDLTFKGNEGEGHYVLEEESFTVSTEGDGFVSGFAYLYRDGFNLNLNYDSYGMMISWSEGDDAERRYLPTLYRCDMPDWTLSADYADKDRYGDITEHSKDASGFFAPVTEDYVISCETSTYYIYDRTTWETKKKLPMRRLVIYSFDENECCIDQKEKVVYEDEASALEVYEYERSFMSEGYQPKAQIGNALYYSSESENTHDGKVRVLLRCADKVHYDCHYFYPESMGNNSGDYYKYAWANKTLEKHEYAQINLMTEELAEVSIPWAAAYYKCTEDSCSKQVWFNGFIPSEFNLESFDSQKSLRVYKDHAIGVAYRDFYEYDGSEGITYSYDKAVVITELAYTSTSLTVSVYVFEIADGDYANTGITFENYMDKECVFKRTHTYDMTKPVK